MTITVKMLGDVAQHAAAMANEAMEMAACLQLIVDDCAEQLAAKRAENETAMKAESETAKKAENETQETVSGTNAEHTASTVEHTADTTPPTTDPPATQQIPLTIVELRARVTELSTPENRPKIKGLLTKFGVKKLTELAPNQYCDFMTEVESACRT